MKKLMMALTVVVLGSAAHAGILIEPNVGYETGTYEFTSSNKGDYSGTMFGARLGYTMMGFMFGVDYSTGSGTAKPDGGGGDGKLAPTDIGAFVGYKFPIMFRAYLSYFLDSKMHDKDASADYKGKGYRIGIGYTGLPFVAINLEMISRSFDEYDGISFTPEMKFSTYALNISLPLP